MGTERGGRLHKIRSTGVALYNRGGGRWIQRGEAYSLWKRTNVTIQGLMIIMFLDAMASLEFMLESERVGDVFGILSNLGRIFRVCPVFYGKHCHRHNRLKYRVVLLKKLLKVVPQALNQNLALTSSILKYMCRAERPFLFQQIQMIQKYLNHFSLQSFSQSLIFV